MLGREDVWWDWVLLCGCPCSRSLSLGAATPETDVAPAAVLSASRVLLAEREDRLELLRCLRAEVGMMLGALYE